VCQQLEENESWLPIKGGRDVHSFQKEKRMEVDMIARPRSKLFKRAYRSQRGRNNKRRKQAVVYRTPNLINPRSGQGNKINVTLNYSDKFNITGGLGGSVAVYIFRMNSFFDPDFTSGGHQPLGYDQFSPLFERYCVTSVKYKVSFASTSGQNALCAVQINDGASVTAGVNLRNVLEQGNAQWKPLAGNTGGPMVVEFAGVCYNYKVMGQTYNQYVSDDTNMAAIATNPSDTVWMSLVVCDAGNTGGPTVNCCVDFAMSGFLLGSAQTAES